MWRIRFPGVVAVLTILVTALSACGFPRDIAGSDPVQVDGLKLEIGIHKEPGFDQSGGIDSLHVTLLLLNLTKEHRCLDDVQAFGNRLDYCGDVLYAVRFADGTIWSFRKYHRFPPRILNNLLERKPLTIPAHGCTFGTMDLRGSLTDNRFTVSFHESFKRNKGKFALTALVMKMGLQSNTLLFNDCPVPPAKYVPLTAAREFWNDFGAKARAEEEELEERRLAIEQRARELAAKKRKQQEKKDR